MHPPDPETRNRPAANGTADRRADFWKPEESERDNPRSASAFSAPAFLARLLFRGHRCPACVGSAAEMNQHTKPPTINRAPSRDYTLALIRVVSRRLKHIDEEVISIGVALSNGLVTAAKARELVDDIAPGCIDCVALSILEGTAE